jgi:predicted transposase/invertase (TIGR01784 family)
MINRNEDPVWRYKAYWDFHNTIAYAVEEAEIKGKIKIAIEIAIRLMSEGFPMEKVAQYTNLPLNEIEKPK